MEDSYKELISLLKWFSHFGPIPTIVGGWAVYFYNSYFGSIDIDIVGASHQGRFTEIIEQYERTHGYEFISRNQLGLEITSRKPVLRNENIIGYVEIDACTFEDPKPSSFHEDPSKQLPYSLTAEKQYQRKVTVEKGAVCYIPCKPLLLLYKIKAARDRVHDLRIHGTTMNHAKAETLRGKITKDRADLLALLDPKPKNALAKEDFDAKTFRNIIKRINLNFTLTTILELPKYRASINLYNPNIGTEEIETWIKKLLS